MSTVRKSTSNGPYEFIAKHYRDPGGEDRIRRWLPHPEVARAICGALRAMKAYCATAAKNLVIDLRREAAKRKRDLAEPCEREEYGMDEPDSAEPHDRVDALRQVEVLASLFREGCMPRDGVFILEGFAAGRSYGEIAGDLGISKDAVEGRMREMRRICRERMEKLGMVPRTPPLRLVVCNPAAMTLLRAAA